MMEAEKAMIQLPATASHGLLGATRSREETKRNSLPEPEERTRLC